MFPPLFFIRLSPLSMMSGLGSWQSRQQAVWCVDAIYRREGGVHRTIGSHLASGLWSGMERLIETHIDPDPFAQFAAWFEEAAHLPEPNAMTLATATPDGWPSARQGLLKGDDSRGFLFFTNYGSRKSGELTRNPRAALVFFWPQLHRQIRIEGVVERVSPEESDAYFATRARGSQIAARASAQSRMLSGREELEERVRAVEEE